jgi:hypothetical protein
MADLSNFLENELYDHVARNAAYTSPTAVYLALFTAVSDAEAGTGTECSFAGYAREAVTFGAPTNGAGSNSAAVEITKTDAGDVTVTHAAIFDAATDGNALTAIKALAASKTLSQDDTIRFAIGELDFSFA